MQQISSRRRAQGRSNVEIVGRRRRWPANRDATSVEYRRQIEVAVMIETPRSGRRDVFAESFSRKRNCDRHHVFAGRRSIQAIRTNAVMMVVVRSREQIGSSRESGAKPGLRHGFSGVALRAVV